MMWRKRYASASAHSKKLPSRDGPAFNLHSTFWHMQPGPAEWCFLQVGAISGKLKTWANFTPSMATYSTPRQGAGAKWLLKPPRTIGSSGDGVVTRSSTCSITESGNTGRIVLDPAKSADCCLPGLPALGFKHSATPSRKQIPAKASLAFGPRAVGSL